MKKSSLLYEDEFFIYVSKGLKIRRGSNCLFKDKIRDLLKMLYDEI